MSKLIYGWITPSKKIIETGLYHHFEILENDEFKAAFPEIKSIKNWEDYESELYSEDSAEFESDIEPGEHPGWHNFYARDMKYMLKLRDFYRFGTYLDSSNRIVIEIEGISTLAGAAWRDFVKKNFVVDRLCVRGSYTNTKYFDI